MSKLVDEVRAALERHSDSERRARIIIRNFSAAEGVAYMAGADSRTEMVCKLVAALDLADDLLNTPEHAQDDEWHDKRAQVWSAIADLKKELGIL